MFLPKVDRLKLKKALADFDYVRFIIPDMNAIPRGKFVLARNADKFIDEGLDIFSAILTMGPLSELPFTHPMVLGPGSGNMKCIPHEDNITNIEWCGRFPKESDQVKVGEILCEPMWNDGSIQKHSPRFLARKQLQILKEKGYTLYSAFEMEFYLLDKNTLKPFSHTPLCMGLLSFSEVPPNMLQFGKMLERAGVDIECFHCEIDAGQLEYTLKPKYGIESADLMFKFKSYMKEMCIESNLLATFMAKPFASRSASGGHFNFSLWDGDDNNVFYDPEKKDNLSSIALYFIGGILKHLPALTAICCPTANCYRRINRPFVPSRNDWDIDNRETTLRIKNLSKKETYIENRLPSSAANPYLVIAATMAAGMDGVDNQINPPVKGTTDWGEIPLPKSLEEALLALENDAVLSESLGTEFVKWYGICKRNMDLAKFGKHNMTVHLEEEIRLEQKEYLKMI